MGEDNFPVLSEKTSVSISNLLSILRNRLDNLSSFSLNLIKVPCFNPIFDPPAKISGQFLALWFVL